MGFMQKTKDLFRMQQQAKKAKKELSNIHVEADGPGVHVVVSGELEIVDIVMEPGADVQVVIDCLNRAVKKAQVIAGERMQEVMKSLGMATDAQSYLKQQ